ncbi:trifunctional serine/threonine-protein kinase/ATP-binding protein/sensor histidine kinase [Aetokthonos hydrillicola Thurmond2011]|jgi:predicted ATPase/signal transduction histidine kinase|uniref:histidine kinase n=1 Tax=Aetokthonos hydrillicola Thurmond2011 TaxID=2712845 RepID=A0AAP5IA16_9CYAN|nr:ATP-binding sensor histidine kinase [Aetokthonos hydrillicola]MBO3461087.1 AAA family ATPase [Aetokthonos hydrillicola CCALA 1050]MBW4590692.1 AAA family ATPase [Aetokthonos hydrillicola CCALA 1050]MDR9897670.1 trifunctional serine/threonine-protein kinase/ATP-binding protein/sensor histidine kinase [Aetokthonos hydrillicola Thurmond2011]
MDVVSIAGYHLGRQIYDGFRTVVYRCIRQTDSLPVVIKLLKNAYPSFNELVQFRNQYTITKNLDYPGIIKAYSLEAYQNGYALVMEDFGGISLKDYFTHHDRVGILDEFLPIAIALASTLDYLMQHGVIHKDIKPANILINPETKQVKLIDFSIASLLPRETQTLISPNILEGTLAYISPEQTGRINRGIDYRTDFYSLGVTFYELLTKELPFPSEDAMELVHSHIAKNAPLVHEINPNIPSVISEIVSKLMAKNPSERYQSALGLKYDLQKCWVQLKETSKIESFTIAKRDVCARFVIPEKLYGREQEVKQLLAAFEKVAQGNIELMLVTGFSGIGKTAVVNEVHKPIVKRRGYFIKGKYDQFNRNIPFSAFVQAFRDLMGQLLAEDDIKLQQWRDKILTALGENAQVIIQVIPELEQIIGSQPPASELSGIAAENRFNLFFQKFIQVFTTKEHPLVIFLDDLQWADSASLKLMQLLIDESDKGYLFLIGAYRDNEVFPGHPLILTLNEIAKAGAGVNTITLSPLSMETVNQLVADTLNCQLEMAQLLTQEVYQKTEGNPFFATQFLKALHEDNYIQFNFQVGHWQCDIAQIKQLALTDDVVEFMAQQLEKLGAATQKALNLAACIGNQFDLATLAIVSEQSQGETATTLWKALQSGLILPISKVYKFYVGEENQAINQEIGHTVGYKFLHDRVQQAAYSLIPEEQKQATHVKIGRLLWQNTPEAELENQIFGIVNQLNIGLEQFQQAKERHEISCLNLIAGKKAKVSTAYSSALAYLKTGIQLLPSNPWESDYNLTINLYTEASEASYLCGKLDEMESFAQEVLHNAKVLIDTVKVYEVKIEAYAVQGNFLAAIDTALQFLQPIGIEFPEEPTLLDFLVAMQETQTILGGKAVAELVNLPEMEDPQLRAALRVLVKLNMPAYLAKPELHRLVVLKQVSLCVRYGNTFGSAVAYSQYGLMLCGQVDSISTGYEFGQLALQLLSKFQAREDEAIVLFLVYSFIIHWKEPLTAVSKPILQAYTTGLDTGDLGITGSAANIYCINAYFAGEELTTLADQLEIYTAVLEKINQRNALNYNNIYQQVVLNLRGSGTIPWELVGSAYDERTMLALHEQTNDGTALWHLFFNKLILCYLFGELDLAAECVVKAKQHSGSVYASPGIALQNFYDSLLQLGLFPKSSIEEQQRILEKVAENQNTMQQWANYAPMNNLHRFKLVEAEKNRILGQNSAAMEFYEKAIALAQENGYIQEEALANELAARFYLDWGKPKVAKAYIEDAYYCYARWGALAKVRDLEKRYPQLLHPILQQQRRNLNPIETISRSISSSTTTTTSGTTNISDILDFTSVLKAAQAISSSLELDQLIANLSRIILENSGAKKSVLILPQEDTWQVKAITLINQQSNSQTSIETIFVSQLIDNCQDIPSTIINYVKNTQETITIDNCQTDIPGVIGEYMLRHQPQSALCIPIINQGNLVGILYLENQFTSGVFTPQRLQVINLLSSQAAISLLNARLYQQAKQALQDLQQAQLQIVQSEKMSALGNLVAGVAHEMNNPLGFIAASLQQAKPIITDIFEHLELYQKSLPSPSREIIDHATEIDLEYSLEDLPKMIDSMNMACDRLTNISTSLRTFSRQDKDYKVPFNIHSGIDSTILILKHRLKANEQRPAIQVNTSYGDLPEIECFPGQLNQVFMNILANAIDALDESNAGRSFEEIQANPNQITITTVISNNQVQVKIADNGVGMDEQVKQKIFDHLFTTKPVGKGTGLGLAIAQQIITGRHNGTLTVNSTLDQGTEFLVSLPIL